MSITFYVPTLNSEATLRKCLEGIFSQTPKPRRVLIIDGNSSDKTLEIAKKFKVKIIKQKKKGLADARNVALKNCNTEYIASVDSDCVPDKDWLSNMMDSFDKDVAGVGGKLIEKHNQKLADRWRAFHLKQDWGNRKIRNPDFLFGSNCVFRAGVLRKVNGYDEKYITNYEDVDISARLMEQGFDLIYQPKARCCHLRADSMLDVIKTARQWSFHSYKVPDSFTGLVMRLLVYNPHLFVNLLMKDIFKLRLDLILVTVLTLFYNEAYDMIYLTRKPKE